MGGGTGAKESSGIRNFAKHIKLYCFHSRAACLLRSLGLTLGVLFEPSRRSLVFGQGLGLRAQHAVAFRRSRSFWSILNEYSTGYLVHG